MVLVLTLPQSRHPSPSLQATADVIIQTPALALCLHQLWRLPASQMGEGLPGAGHGQLCVREVAPLQLDLRLLPAWRQAPLMPA